MKSVTAIIVLAFAALTLGLVVFMPAAELMPAQVEKANPKPGDSPAHSQELMNVFKDIAEQGLGMLGHDPGIALMVKSDPLFPYKMWSLFFAGALVASGVALNAIGREESEEKTVIPLKK
jgi:hypothetical protein